MEDLCGEERIPAPADIENGVERAVLRYRFRIPDAGVGERTGLILYIPGYGFSIDDGYTGKLHSRLANTHDCVVATVDYFGSGLIAGRGVLAAAPDLFSCLERHHGIALGVPPEMPADVALMTAVMILERLGITNPHHECQAVVADNEYNSFGFIPALDHLQVTWHLLSRIPLDRSRLYVIGSSYGGYIASLLIKLAPATFRMVVDNCGFSGPEDDWSGVLGYSLRGINSVQITARSTRHWSRTPGPWHFGEPQWRLRSLREGWNPSRTQLYAYHAAEDRVASTGRKRALPTAIGARFPYDLRIIGPADIDGRIFKVPEHGLGASLSGLFDLSMERYLATAPHPSPETDFTLGGSVRYGFGTSTYWLSYSVEHGVEASLVT